jgi:tRNA threonylcarbamoyladenosine dehydratase
MTTMILHQPQQQQPQQQYPLWIIHMDATPSVRRGWTSRCRRPGKKIPCHMVVVSSVVTYEDDNTPERQPPILCQNPTIDFYPIHSPATDSKHGTTTATTTTTMVTNSTRSSISSSNDTMMVASIRDDDDDDDNDYPSRFRGVGRLYSTSTSSGSISSGSGSSINNDTSSGTTLVSDISIPETVQVRKDPINTDGNTTRTTTTTSSNDVLYRLQHAVVVVVGIGGVGSWTAEALGRSGIGTIVLIDMDDICRSNINRQLHALSNTIGSMKIDIIHQRLLQINPDCTVHRIYDFVTADNVYPMFDSIAMNWGTTIGTTQNVEDNTDVNGTIRHLPPLPLHHPTITAVVDCMDGARDKAALIAYCNDRGVPIVTVGSTAGRMHPTQITSGDLSNVHLTMGHGVDRLLTSVRKELRQHYHFQPGRPFGRKSKPWGVDCVYSEEEIVTTNLTMVDSTTSSSSFRKCDNGVLGTASFVTGTFGFVAASMVVQAIAQNQLRSPCGTGTKKKTT